MLSLAILSTQTHKTAFPLFGDLGHSEAERGSGAGRSTVTVAASQRHGDRRDAGCIGEVAIVVAGSHILRRWDILATGRAAGVAPFDSAPITDATRHHRRRIRVLEGLVACCGRRRRRRVFLMIGAPAAVGAEQVPSHGHADISCRRRQSQGRAGK